MRAQSGGRGSEGPEGGREGGGEGGLRRVEWVVGFELVPGVARREDMREGGR
jgi:hypothetical protein